MSADGRRRHARRRPACLLALLLGVASTPLRADGDDEPGETPAAEGADQQSEGCEARKHPLWPELSKGTVEWGLAGNAAIAHRLWGAAPDREFVSVGMRAGRILSGPRGPGFLRGRLAVNVEVYPLFLMFQESTTYAFTFTLLGRHYLETATRARPFISAGVGLLLSRQDIPPDTTRVNFTPQVGLGIALPDSHRRVYTFEYRLHHISNASLADRNPGINSSYFQFGVTFFRERRPR